MDYDGPTQAMEKAAYGGLNSLSRPQTKREQLLDMRKAFQQKVREIDDALTALDENPGAEKVMDTLRKVGL
jgi:hypothetical protein